MSSAGLAGFMIMKTKITGFTTSFRVKQPAQQCFDAINDVRGWWTGEIEGKSGALGDAFTYRFKDMHRSTQTVTELVPGQRVVWQVSNAVLSFVKDKNEWNGTQIIFEISRHGDETEVRFTHAGLLPAFECYADCSNAWGFYVNDSLMKLITTGRGEPNR